MFIFLRVIFVCPLVFIAAIALSKVKVLLAGFRERGQKMEKTKGTGFYWATRPGASEEQPR